jgi:hypothetical protein
MVVKVAIITGWDRSGSTILANILGSTPGVVTLGEINNIWERGFRDDLLCACEQRFSRCELWHPIAERAFGADLPRVAARAKKAMDPLGNAWLLERHLPLALRRDRSRSAPYARLLGSLYGSAHAHTAAQLLVDSSKIPWHAAVAYELEGCEVYILHLVRDPRGVAYSHGKSIRYDVDAERPRYMARHGLTESSAAWVYRNRLTEATWKGERNYMVMRYEDFVASPSQELRRFFAWVGLEGASPTFHDDRTVEVGLVHNISGNPVRFRHGPVEIKADDTWREGLAIEKQRWVRAVTWPHMAHYGYRR